MIKFFRKIRQRLLTENNFSKYLLYAFGEILLVVIGILIALQINNWNQQRLDNQEESKLILSISEKIEFNKFQYNVGIIRYNEVINSAQQLLQDIHSPNTNRNHRQFEEDLHSITKRFLMGKSNSVSIYDEMIGAGQLTLLSSDDLRKSITSLKANLQLLESYEGIQIDFVEHQLNPFLNRNTDIISIYANGSISDSSYYDRLIAIDYSSFYQEDNSRSYDRLRQNREFSNLLFELIKQTKTVLPIYNRIGENISEIESIINSMNA